MKTMKRYFLIFGLIWMTALLSANECGEMQSAYEAADEAYETSIRDKKDARTRYPLINRAMDKAVALLAYCHEDISLSKQHLLRNRLRKLDQHRSSLASAVVNEYRQEYGVKPEVTTRYRDVRYSDSPSSSPLPPPIRKPLPPVIQPVLPPILK